MVVAGVIGNSLEWYDFGLFGFFAPVIARQMIFVDLTVLVEDGSMNGKHGGSCFKGVAWMIRA